MGVTNLQASLIIVGPSHHRGTLRGGSSWQCSNRKRERPWDDSSELEAGGRLWTVDCEQSDPQGSLSNREGHCGFVPQNKLCVGSLWVCAPNKPSRWRA